MRTKAESYVRVLKNRAFSVFLLTRGGSRLGDAFFDLALLWLVYTGTGSTLAAAGVTIANRVAVILINLVSGTLVDRWDRRRIMIHADLWRAGVVALVALAAWKGMLTPWLAFGAVFVLQVLGQFFSQAAMAFLPRIIARGDLVVAHGLLSSTLTGAEIVGKGLAGIVIAAVGTLWAFLVDALSFLLGALGVRTLPEDIRPSPSGQGRRDSGDSGLRGFRSSLREGWEVLHVFPVFRGMMVVALVVNLVAIGALVPAIVQRNLQGGPEIYGLLEAILLGGIIVGGLTVGWVNERLGAGPIWILSLVGMGIALIGVGLSVWLPLTALCFLALGVAEAWGNAPFTALVQSTVPERYLGRAFGFLGAVNNLLAPLGAALFGWLGDLWGPGPVFVLGGIWGIFAGVLAWRNPHLRTARVEATS